VSSPTALPVEPKGPVTLDELAVRGLVIGGRVIDLIRGTGPGGAEFRFRIPEYVALPSTESAESGDLAALKKRILEKLAGLDCPISRSMLASACGLRGDKGRFGKALKALRDEGRAYSRNGNWADRLEKFRNSPVT
jgi:hypothetical protein